jgi:hypothetical protein
MTKEGRKEGSKSCGLISFVLLCFHFDEIIELKYILVILSENPTQPDKPSQ